MCLTYGMLCSTACNLQPTISPHTLTVAATLRLPLLRLSYSTFISMMVQPLVSLPLKCRGECLPSALIQDPPPHSLSILHLPPSPVNTATVDLEVAAVFLKDTKCATDCIVPAQNPRLIELTASHLHTRSLQSERGREGYIYPNWSWCYEDICGEEEGFHIRNRYPMMFRLNQQ